MDSEKAPPTATYFDGYVIRPRPVTLEFEAAIDLFENGAFLAAWPYGDIRRLRSPTGAMRIRSVSAPKNAWLEITDPAQQREVETHCKLLGGEPPPDTRAQKRRLAYGALAAVMIGAFVYGGVPRMAGLIAPMIPDSWEKKLGEAVDDDIHEMFPGKKCDAAKGVAALKKLSQTMQEAAHLRIPADMKVIGSKTPNAFAMPGGKVYLLEGLLSKAQSQDEVIGVLAHELGHLQHRDHMRRIIATGGTAMIVGMIFGDISGGGVLVALGNTLIGAAHSREAEAQADDFAAQTMARLGRPAKPMGELLVRITGDEKTDGLLTVLRDHPVSEERLAKLAKADKGASKPPVLTDEEWKALKGICDSK